ncbi:unnamed protein product [Lactuca virosa]|uniref:Uncharacterized protein n=1 Tax=Lactuca virosa TaxID=75947 RepID=A0AAU9LBL7_9ASTR|nr:unnamed protein product [Lactuca virosa]
MDSSQEMSRSRFSVELDAANAVGVFKWQENNLVYLLQVLLGVPHNSYIFFVGFNLPQGSLLYWAANNSLTLVQKNLASWMANFWKIIVQYHGRTGHVI